MAVTREMERLCEMALAAGEVVMRFYRQDVAVERKSDESPVTEADRSAEALLLHALAEAFPDVPVVAEEAAAAGLTPQAADCFFLVDPLDGTREFVSGRGEFTVNIGLVERGQPVLGVVHAPATGALFVGAAGQGAYERIGGALVPLAPRRSSRRPPVALASRSHSDPQTEALLDRLGVVERVAIGSSLKFCLLARGDADLYPRFGRTMEWDTAAGHAVLAAAGGRVVSLDGGAFAYGKRGRADEADFANPGFLAGVDAAILDLAAAEIARLDR